MKKKLRIQQGKTHIKFMVVILEFELKLSERLALKLLSGDFKHEKAREGAQVSCNIDIPLV